MKQSSEQETVNFRRSSLYPHIVANSSFVNCNYQTEIAGRDCTIAAKQSWGTTLLPLYSTWRKTCTMVRIDAASAQYEDFKLHFWRGKNAHALLHCDASYPTCYSSVFITNELKVENFHPRPIFSYVLCQASERRKEALGKSWWSPWRANLFLIGWACPCSFSLCFYVL